MSTAPAALSLEQYLLTSYHPDVHFVNGEIEERNLGEFDHGRLTGLLFAFFFSRERSLRVKSVVEQRIRVSAEKVRICDFVLLRPGTPKEQVTQTAPLLCVEILSPEDRLSRAKIVLDDYLHMGVSHIWLLDPMRRIAYTYDLNGLHLRESTLSIPELNISLDIEPMFADLDDDQN